MTLNNPIGNWTSYVQSEINGKENASFIVGKSGGGTTEPATDCKKRFTATYQCGSGPTKEVNIAPEAWGQAALFDCTAESKQCAGFKMTLGDDGNMVITNSNNSKIWSSNTNKTGIALDQFSAKNGKNGRNYLMSGEVLGIGEFIGSPSGNCYLMMVKDLGLQLKYNVSSCFMTDDNTGYGTDDNTFAIYSLDKTTNVSNLGKVGYINHEGKINEYPDSMIGLGTDYTLIGNYDSPGHDIKQLPDANANSNSNSNINTIQFENSGRQITWEDSKQYAKNKQGRLVTFDEAQAFIKQKGGVLTPGQDQWVAITDDYNSNGRDWFQIGNNGHPPGISHIKSIGAYPVWGDNTNAVTNSTFNYYVMWIPLANTDKTTLLAQCKQECNTLDNCSGFSYNNGDNKCYLKNSEMYPKGLRQENSNFELYARNKSVTNNASCSKIVEPTSTMMWELLPTGEKMSMDTLCSLGVITEQEKRELDEKNNKLKELAGVIGGKVQNLSNVRTKLSDSMNMNINKLKSNINSYNDIQTERKNYSDNSGTVINADAMLEDSDLNMVSQNYKNLIWTHLAILLAVGVIAASRY